MLPGIPHHVTQRGLDETLVFPTDYDKGFYLDALKFLCRKHAVRVLGYCLMTNHVHLILIPPDIGALGLVMGRLQGKYCQYFNASHKRKGSLWHDRFFSCALGGVHLIEALRYVDRNPVRAGIAVDSLDYPWSSACVHAGCEDTAGLIDLDSWHRIVDGLDWNGFLREGDNERALTVIREHTRTGSPLGVKK